MFAERPPGRAEVCGETFPRSHLVGRWFTTRAMTTLNWVKAAIRRQKQQRRCRRHQSNSPPVKSHLVLQRVRHNINRQLSARVRIEAVAERITYLFQVGQHIVLGVNHDESIADGNSLQVDRPCGTAAPITHFADFEKRTVECMFWWNRGQLLVWEQFTDEGPYMLVELTVA